MYLIKNANVFAPEKLGIKDILIFANKIVKIDTKINVANMPVPVTVIDAKNCTVIPGLVDGHQHFTGGGGEGGYSTKVAPMRLDTNTLNGVTTAVGLLGTDAISRDVESLYARTQAFNEEGITAFMLTGSYWSPSPTITGSISKDFAFIDHVIGLKLAIADHRAPFLLTSDIAKIAAEVRIAKLIGNKPGFITLHTGTQEIGLSQILTIIDEHKFAPTLFLPTHINRRSINKDCIEFAKKGGLVDATARNYIAKPDINDMNAAELINQFHEMGLIDKVSISSDAGGSLPQWNDDRTKILGMGVGTPESLFFELDILLNKYKIPLEIALKPFTQTPANFYGLGKYKGRLAQGYDADILILDKDELKVNTLFAKGEMLVADKEALKKGYFDN